MSIQQPVNYNRKVLFYQIGAWSLSLVASLVALIAWGATYNWNFTPLSPYQLFPLLGLLAFSIMWSHYINSTIRQFAGLERAVFRSYFRVTSYVVLVLLILHPGILIYQRFRDGFGLPPGSYESYVAPGLGWITLLGTASLFIFLAFEFRRVFSKQPWWHFVTEAGDLAMLAILYHGLRLGSDLQQGWFRYVWLFYLVTLVAVLLRNYYKRYASPKAVA